MSLIKPRIRGKQFVPVRVRLEQQNYETLHAYAAFLDEDVEYVLNELLDRVLAKDKAFVTWRVEHQSSAPPTRPARTRDRVPHPDGVRPAATTDIIATASPNGRR